MRTTSAEPLTSSRAKQSSDWRPQNGAGKAVDGSTDGNGEHNVSHTKDDPQAWWQVDLGQVYQITDIEIWNRTDGYGDRLSNYFILVSETPFRSARQFHAPGDKLIVAPRHRPWLPTATIRVLP